MCVCVCVCVCERERERERERETPLVFTILICLTLIIMTSARPPENISLKVNINNMVIGLAAKLMSMSQWLSHQVDSNNQHISNPLSLTQKFRIIESFDVINKKI